MPGPRIGAGTEAHGLASEPAFCRWQQVKPEQADIAPGRQQWLVAAEQAGDLVGEADGQGLVETLALVIGLQSGKVARKLWAEQQRVGQRLHITQRQVETLAGNRVQAVRGVAQHHQVWTDLLLGFDQRQRVEMPGTDLAQAAEPITEGTLQLAQETALVDLGQTLGIHPLARPDQRAAVFRQWQQGHRTLLGETLKGLAAVGLAGCDVGDQGALLIGRTAHVDSQLLTQAGAATVSQHRQVTFQAGVVVQQQAVATLDGLHRLHFGRAAPAHHLAVQPLPQALPEPGVLHHVSQGRHAFFHGVQASGAETATVGNLDLPDRLGARADGLPEAEVLVDLPSAERQCRRARIVAGLEAVAGGERLDQQDLPAARLGACLQGQSQACAHQPATNDRQVDPTHAASLRAACISASISATVRGTPEVRISQPCLVTTTSSSILIPMPRHFFATSWLSAAM